MWNLSLIFAVVLVAILVAAFIVSETFRGWLGGIWRRWFKDSEVNFAADLLWIGGLLIEVSADPDAASMLEKLGLTPKSIMVIGILFRILRMLRDRSMVPLTRDGD